MGSLKDDAMKGLREDHKPCEKTDDEKRPGGSDGSAEPDGPQINTSPESTAPQLEDPSERDENAEPNDEELSVEGRGTDSVQTGDVPLTQDDKTTTSSKSLSEGDEGTQKDETCGVEENILVPVPATPGPSDPRSPAPSGQQHMRTQVSLEVVQCCSVATSPMTPPQDGHSFFFPSSFGKSGAAAAAAASTKDAELQVGRLVEFCSVATSPMTPKTPSTSAFPELTGREAAQKQEGVKNGEAERERGQQEGFPGTESLGEAESLISGALTSKEPSEDFASACCTATGSKVSPETPEDSQQQCKQQRMGSMDQDITILVTHYGNGEEEEEADSSLYPIDSEMVKLDEYEEQRGIDGEDEKENIPHVQETSNTTPPQNNTQESSVSVCTETKTDVKVEANESKGDVAKPPVPESPAPFGCHNIRTQVSLEVVQCQSAATSPMTPPEGDHAFCFPSTLGRCGGVDAELQVGQQVEFRSVATAPMTPRTPTVTTFPEIVKNASVEEKIEEEEEEEVTEEKKVEAAEEEEAVNCKEKGEEPVQEVSWDEKGMTWEVYGAVVEVAVLGSAIQKHLEKQVKKQKQPSLPPPPPLNPSAVPLSPESIQGGGSGPGRKSRPGKRGERDGEVSRRRRNPFRLLMENMQQPHCCSGAHTAE